MIPEVDQTEVSMPLFVLNAVVFPKMKFPMHIFEPRYRLMLRRCLEGQKKFGLISCKKSTNGRWIPVDVGCILQITEHQQLPDGRSYIDCVGTKRFKVLESWDQDGYLCGKIQYLTDYPMSPEEKEQFIKYSSEIRGLMTEVISSASGKCEGLAKLLARAGDIPNDDEEYIYWLCGNIPIPETLKQELLEITNTNLRAIKLHEILNVFINSNIASSTQYTCSIQ